MHYNVHVIHLAQPKLELSAIKERVKTTRTLSQSWILVSIFVLFALPGGVDAADPVLPPLPEGALPEPLQEPTNQERAYKHTSRHGRGQETQSHLLIG